MNTPQLPPNPGKLLRKPLTEFLDRVSAPANLHKTLNGLVFGALRRGDTLLPDEADNLNALLDFLLACQLGYGVTVLIAEA